MQPLKALVIGMGVLIVVGLTIVIVTFVRRGDMPPATSIGGGPMPPIAGASGGFGETRVALPPGAFAEETVADGARLIVRLRLPDGEAALLLIDARTGRKLGLILLVSNGAGQ